MYIKLAKLGILLHFLSNQMIAITIEFFCI